jgi:pyruvate/2-oxoglutarate dehydrogenase complex dihydrolipoamide dehydrogenase (E3) component
MARVRRVIDEGVDYYERLLVERGIDLVRLPARFVSPRELEAGDLRIAFSHALIATGARPRTLDIPGADAVPTVTSDDLMFATELPGHFVSVGAGAVSLEFAQAYRRLGAQVTIVQRGDHLAHGEDEELGDLLKAYLEEEGVRVLTRSRVDALELVDGRPAVLCAGGARVVGDVVLLGVGREPVTDGMGLDEVGIAYDASGVTADRFLRTTLPQVFSVGDVVDDGLMFTHVATYQAPIAIANMLDGADRELDYRTMPRAIFTDPVFAAAGLTESQARAAGHEVEIRRSDVGTRGKARATGDPRGRVKFVLDAKTGVILGVGILAKDGADLLPGPQVAMNAPGGTLAPLLATVHTHPTISEAVKVAARSSSAKWDSAGAESRRGDPPPAAGADP